MHQLLAWASLLLILHLVQPAGTPGELQRFEFSHPQMGTLFRILLYSDSKKQAERASAAAFRRVDALNQILSDWERNSEVNRLVRADPGKFHTISPDLYAVIRASGEFAEVSDGAFDITSGPLVALWRRAGSLGTLPDAAEIRHALQRTGPEKLELDEETSSVRLRLRGMRLDLGGIAKGYALDEAMKILRENGIRHALIDGGGDIAVSAAPPGREGWSVSVDSPEIPTGSRQTLVLADCAVATSGDTQQFWIVGGKRYSHIVDPRTGTALAETARVTVIAPCGTQADALATALCILEPGRGLTLIESFADTSARVVRRSAGGFRVYTSAGYPG